MYFNSLEFAIFLAISLSLYWALIPLKWRRQYLVLCGLVFVSFHALDTLLLFVALSIVVYMAGQLLSHPELSTKSTFATSLASLTGVLVLYKYSGMLTVSLNNILELISLPEYQLSIPAIALPLGISFIVFECLHYLIECYHKKIPKHSFLDFFVFIFFFPSLVSGPIKRFNDFFRQTKENKKFDSQLVRVGVGLIITGLFKKIVIADTMNFWTDRFQDPGAYTSGMLWAAALAYSIKIYFDFSGYTDIARGVGKLFGFVLPLNFNYPYLRSNIASFWRHWHMSLSSWIKDYLYVPLGGSRKHPARVILNLLIVMAICGLWHGAGWNFALWGLYHGVGLAIYFAYRQWRGANYAKAPTPWYRYGLGTLSTFAFVTVGWVMFAVPGATEMVETYKIMFAI